MSRIFANIWESDRFFSDNIDNRHHLTPWIKPMVIFYNHTSCVLYESKTVLLFRH